MLRAVLAIVLVQEVAGAALFDALQRVTFLNKGITNASDHFHWEIVQTVGDKQVPIYLEADNVSCVKCVWSDGGKYYVRLLCSVKCIVRPYTAISTVA